MFWMASIHDLHMTNISDSQRNTASICVCCGVSWVDAYTLPSTEIPSGISHGGIIDHSM